MCKKKYLFFWFCFASFFFGVQTLYNCWVYNGQLWTYSFQRNFCVHQRVFIDAFPAQTNTFVLCCHFLQCCSVKSLKHCLTITSLKFFTCVHIFGELKLFSSWQAFKNVNRVVFSSHFQCESSEHYASCLLLLWLPLAEIMFCVWTICAVKSLCG